MIRPRSIGRRTFLYTTGGAALGMPFLASLLPRGARAADPAPIKRFVGIQSYSGMIAKEWYPNKAPAGYQLGDALYPGTPKADGTVRLTTKIPSTNYTWAPLSDFAATGFGNILGTNLNPWFPKMNVIRGIDQLVPCGHNQGGYFGNAGYTSKGVAPWIPTVDQVMAYSSKVYPTAPRLRSLHLGTGMPNSCSFTNYGMAGGKVEQISHILDPAAAYDRVFRGFMAPTGGITTTPESPNKSLVNAVYGDFTRVSTSPRLSAADKQVFDRHMTFLADIERSLAARTVMTSSGCTVPNKPRSIPNGAPWESMSSLQDFKDTISLMIDVAVAAFKCDITRVVTFDVQEALYDYSGTTTNSLHNSADINGDWHQFAHNQDGNATMRAKLIAISQWIAKAVFAGFLQKLDVPEASGRTYLDNSLVVWGNELGYNHYNTDLPTVTAGSAGGALKTGYFADYINWGGGYANPIPNWGTLIPGVPQNRWLAWISTGEYSPKPGAAAPLPRGVGGGRSRPPPSARRPRLARRQAMSAV